MSVAFVRQLATVAQRGRQDNIMTSPSKTILYPAALRLQRTGMYRECPSMARRPRADRVAVEMIAAVTQVRRTYFIVIGHWARNEERKRASPTSLTWLMLALKSNKDRLRKLPARSCGPERFVGFAPKNLAIGERIHQFRAKKSSHWRTDPSPERPIASSNATRFLRE